jgi:GntR family transcriptional regulator
MKEKAVMQSASAPPRAAEVVSGRVVRGHVISISAESTKVLRANGHALSVTNGGVGKLDLGSPIPLYVQLARKLADYIRATGESAIGLALPSENECIRYFGVSRPTVRQAMSELMAEGLIRREKGRGTFIRGSRVEHDITHVFEEDMRAASKRVTFRLLCHGLVPFPKELVDVFKAGPRESLYRVQRLRSVSGRVIGLEDRYFLERFASDLDENVLSSENIFTILRRCTGARQVHALHTVSSEIPHGDTANLLGIEKASAVLVRETTYYTEPDTPVMYGRVVFLGDSYQLRFEATVELK